jgi:tetratricopeptide (TPR) repeat protein
MSNYLIAAAAALTVALGATLAAPPVVAKGEPKETPAPKKKCEKGKKCLRDDLSTDEVYYSGYWLARTGQYADAIDMLNKAPTKDERILTYIGFATRKLGDHDKAMGFYTRALELNPNYTVARAYMGEAFIHKGDLAKARGELVEIEKRCGKTCAEYAELAAELAKVAD